MRWPSAARIAEELRLLNANTLGGVRVLLQVRPADDGDWTIYTGDQRHVITQERGVGYWGGPLAIPGCGGRNNYPRRFNSLAVARELIRQAKAHAVQKGPFEQEQPFFMQRPADDYGDYSSFPQQGSRYLHGLGAIGRGDRVSKVQLDRGGYDRAGRYFGAPIFQYGRWVTPPLYLVQLADGREQYVRATSREEAYALVSQGA